MYYIVVFTSNGQKKPHIFPSVHKISTTKITNN